MCSNCDWNWVDDAGEWEHEELTEELCRVCAHPLSAHDDKYGCQVELGDTWVDGEQMGALMALPPCGCQHWRPPDARLEQLIASAYSAYISRTLASNATFADSQARLGRAFNALAERIRP